MIQRCRVRAARGKAVANSHRTRRAPGPRGEWEGVWDAVTWSKRAVLQAVPQKATDTDYKSERSAMARNWCSMCEADSAAFTEAVVCRWAGARKS
ncbi:protein of unknown function [Hyphomicrobium sp. MC1]|nr:protein of unknown function [Hyphomicrobium sp. MC1]